MQNSVYTKAQVDIYDILYLHGYQHGRKRNYSDEAQTIAGWIRQRNPEAASLLDVACGTGEHLSHLHEYFTHVEGLELSAPMRQAASAKLPDISVHAGDMRDFDLGTRFDAVTCLSSSIGYLPSVDALPQAVAAMARHLNPGGVLVVEPWFTLELWHDQAITYTIAEVDGCTVVHMGHSSSRGRTSVMAGQYLVGEPSGIRHFQDEHVMTLFTDEEYCQAFEDAGFQVDRAPSNLPGRGDAVIGLMRS